MSQSAADEVFLGARERVCKMGGMRAWRERMRANSFEERWEEVGEDDEDEDGDGEREREEGKKDEVGEKEEDGDGEDEVGFAFFYVVGGGWMIKADE